MTRQLHWIGLFLVACAVALPAQAQVGQDQSDRPLVAVVGRGEAEREAEYGVIRVDLSGEGNVQIEALGELESARAQMIDSLTRLEGADVAIRRTDDVRIERVFGPECEAEDYNPQRSEGACEPRGYVASLDLLIEVRPAAMAGQALSLAAEMGATRVSADSFGIDDLTGLRNQAARAAFENARDQAELLAGAGGQRIGPIVRIQDSAARGGPSLSGLIDEDEVADVVVTGSRVRPAVTLAVSPEPVTVQVNLTVVFELIP